jgi:hypothetical protein
MSPPVTSLIAFAIIFAGAFIGMFMRQRLPGLLEVRQGVQQLDGQADREDCE